MDALHVLLAPVFSAVWATMDFALAVFLTGGVLALAYCIGVCARVDEPNIARVALIAWGACLIGAAVCVGQAYYAYQVSLFTPRAGAALGGSLFALLFALAAAYLCTFVYRRARKLDNRTPNTLNTGALGDD